MAPGFVAMLRRSAGGAGLKAAKHGLDLCLADTRAANLSTYVTRWPRHLTQYICFGASMSSLRTQQSRLVTRIDQRGYIAVADALPSREAATLPFEQEKSEAEVTERPVPAAAARIGLHKLRAKYERGEPLCMLTAYDYMSARLADKAGADMLLVGDSLGMVVLGQEDTTEVTVDQMVHHSAAAARGVSRAFLVGDLPFGSYLTPAAAAHNGVRLVKEGRVDAVKLEGGLRVVEQVRALVDAGVAVMGHIGLTPQSYAQLGGYRVQGRTAEQAYSLLAEARALEKAGCFAIVLEMVPGPVAAMLTERLSVPTIGIGAGVATSGQVQVWHDVLGLYDKKAPKFAMRRANLEPMLLAALKEYCVAVGARTFPSDTHTFGMAAAELEVLTRRLGPITAAGPNGTLSTTFSTPVASKSKYSNSDNTDRLDSRDGPASTDSMDSTDSTHSTDSTDRTRSIDRTPPSILSGHSPSTTSTTVTTVTTANSHAPSSGRRAAPRVVRTISEWRALRASLLTHASVGLVPTMGALHAGHLSLAALAKRDNGVVVASIFVNPTQFGPNEDFGRYPRTWQEDLEKLQAAGVDYVFAPETSEMYPRASSSSAASLSPYIDFDGIDSLAEARARPNHFRGVATVVAKLLNIVKPSSVYFGQKDAMQCVVVRRLVDDLNFDTKVVVGETVRESDGLAMSSRNAYLSPAERQIASTVHAALRSLAAAADSGETDAAKLRDAAAEVVRTQPALALEYVSVASDENGAELETLPAAKPGVSRRGAVASIAVKLGATRLIDNILL
mmetsp:Transcript_15871/g.33726  ORF Transcript_15871/g.33726 Transcript_15871/m.33726 type:complete len:786 (-) Transcript_15871:898-3255(-)